MRCVREAQKRKYLFVTDYCRQKYTIKSKLIAIAAIFLGACPLNMGKPLHEHKQTKRLQMTIPSFEALWLVSRLCNEDIRSSYSWKPV